MSITLKRVYRPPGKNDGYRVLVDRLWPRGISKDQADIDLWIREIAPSPELRNNLHAGRLRWADFRRRYLSELKNHRERLRALAEKANRGRITLLFGSKDEWRNNAVVLKEYLHRLGAR